MIIYHAHVYSHCQTKKKMLSRFLLYIHVVLERYYNDTSSVRVILILRLIICLSHRGERVVKTRGTRSEFNESEYNKI